jgi:4,5-dihydroxyphthalate decarboxylase
MNFALLCRPRTQAILDGRLKADGLPIHWNSIGNPLTWIPPSPENDRGMLSGGFVGGEMSLSSFIQAKSHGARLLALPIFLKRGLAQRSLFCSAGSPLASPRELIGKRVGLVGYMSSMAIWMRGVLSDDYELPRSGPLWYAIVPSSQTKLLRVPEEYAARDFEAWEELDGYSHALERRECFLISLLEQGELDAVVSFQTGIAAKKIRPLLPDSEHLWFHYRKRAVYPINHIFVMHEEFLKEFPRAEELLLSIFREARKLWVNYLSVDKKAAIEREIKTLGWDPFAYHLGTVEKSTLGIFIDYLLDEKIISRRLPLDTIFFDRLAEAGT